MAYMGKIKFYRAAADVSDEWKMSRFMMSPKGYYNGDIGMMILAALDHARDYPETDPKFGFWHRVAGILEMEKGKS